MIHLSHRQAAEVARITEEHDEVLVTEGTGQMIYVATERSVIVVAPDASVTRYRRTDAE